MSFASDAPGGPSRLRRQLKMDGPFEHSADEIKRLQRCNSDLVSVLALPAMWTGAEASQIVHTLLDALLGMLDLDLVYVRLKGPVGDTPLEMVRVAPSRKLFARPQEIGDIINRWLGEEPQKWPPLARNSIGGEDISIVPLRLGLQGDIGVIVAGARRAEFPRETERLLLNVAANQASIGLQEARLLSEQKRIANELDRQVAKRTAELAAAEERWRSVFENSAIGVALTDLNGRFLAANPVYQEMLGYTEEELQKLSFLDLTQDEDLEPNQTLIEELLAGKRQQFQIEKQYRRKNGSLMWVRNNVSMVPGTERVPRFLMALSEDITERKRAKDALLASEVNLRRVIDAIPTLAWCNLPDGPNEFLNKRWHAYTGLSPEESHGWGWQVAFHPEDLPLLMKTWQELLMSGQSGEIEARLRRHDGVYRWFLIRVEPLRDEEGKVVRWYGTSTDIEDLKQSQEHSRRAEEKTRLIIDTALDAVITINAQGTITGWNKQAEIVFGWSDREAIGQHMADMIIPEQQRRAHQSGLSHFLATGDGPILRRRIEVTAVRRNGVEFPVELEVSPMKLGQDWFFSAFIRDITDSKLAAEKLRESELNFRTIVDSIPGFVCALSPEGEIELLNRQLLEYYGKTMEEMKDWANKDWANNDNVHPDDRSHSVAIFRNAIKSGTPCEFELRLRRVDGVYRWFQVRILPVRDTEARITRWYALMTDTEDRKRAEERLRRSEAFLIQGQRVSRTGTFSWRPDTNDITWSEETYHIHEIDPGTPVSSDLARIGVHPDDIPSVWEAAARGLETGGDYEHSHRLLMPDGRIKFLHVTAHATRDLEGRPEYIGAIQDVTQRRLSDDALSKARSELANVARITTLGVLTASIAHEVNQPLSGIVTNASTCLRMLAAEPPNVEGARETARRTIRDGNRMSDVITRLRALFGKKDAATESVNLNEAAREVIALSLAELQKNRVILHHEFAAGLPLVAGDRVQLQQVIFNLLRNGSDAMSAVEDRPRQLVIRTEQDEGDRVRLTVQDAGVGFDPQAADRLFDAFYTTKGDGMGIGLSISRSIIESHHGRLWATLNDGPGAAFSFSIPREPQSATASDGNREIRSSDLTDAA